MAKNDDIKTEDKVRPTITVPTGPSTFVNVKVLAENGIFKNGKLHKEGSELEMEQSAAERFAELGEVEVLGEVETDE